MTILVPVSKYAKFEDYLANLQLTNVPDVEAVLDRDQLPRAQLSVDVSKEFFQGAAAVGGEDPHPDLLPDEPPQEELGGERLHLGRVLHL